MSCFKACSKHPDDASDLTSDFGSEDPTPEPPVIGGTKMSRPDIVNSLKREKSGGVQFEEELNVLSKIYANEECADDLEALGRRDRGALLSYVPMILNALLYGYEEVRKTQAETGNRRRHSNSSRSSDGSQILDATRLLERSQQSKNLELALLKQCSESVDFALNCAYYLQSSLKLGPPEAEHRTVRLLLQVQAAVMSSVDGDATAGPSAPPTEGAEVPLSAVDVKTIHSYKDSELMSWLEIQKQSGDFYHAQRDWVSCLTDISRDLFEIDKPQRKEALRRELEKLNEHLPRNVYVPVDNVAHRVLRVIPEECTVFSTKERCPYYLTLEVEDFRATASANQTRRTPAVDLANRRTEAFEYTVAIDGPREGDGEPQAEGQEPVDADGTATETADEASAGFGELWKQKEERLRKVSKYGDRPNWRLTAVIVKARDQLRQEMFAQTLITEFAKYFASSKKIGMWVKDYRILATQPTAGFVECIFDSKSLHAIKGSMPTNLGVNTLKEFFKNSFGEPNSPSFKKAMNNFVVSMAGYAVVSYLLHIKDRHNGNLMLDATGRMIHIDFGFMLSNSPGGNFEFEKAPFKLSSELMAVLGGPASPYFKRFRKLSRVGYAETCKSSFANKILLMVDMMYQGNEDMPCFVRGRDYVLKSLKERFSPNTSSKDRRRKWDDLVAESEGNITTKVYDVYQKCFTGIN